MYDAKIVWYFLGHNGWLTSVKSAEAVWITKSGGHSALYTIFALIDHSPVGRIHSEEWA